MRARQQIRFQRTATSAARVSSTVLQVSPQPSVRPSVQQQPKPLDAVAIASIACAASLLLCSPSLAAVPVTSAVYENVGFMTDEEVDEERKEFRFIRAYDGKVGGRADTQPAATYSRMIPICNY